MFAPETIADLKRIAAETGMDAPALMAVAEIESGGRVYALIDGRREPLIRFEGHYFDRRLNGARREAARAAGLSSPVAGRVANPGSQAARWRMLEKAAAIDRKAAYESVSWGLGQVMGAHWAWLGYASVDALVAEARHGAAGQTRLMARYIVKAGLDEALALRDWAGFARGYNGPHYHRNRYDRRLAAAYARYAGDNTAGSERPVTGLLRRGDAGGAVAELQRALSAAGYPLKPDGNFGPLTEAALQRFQKDVGIRVDGIAGPETKDRLRRSLSASIRLKAWWQRLRSLVRRLLARRGN